jgi:ADP-ribose pyrophosphatase YjhB (NUDIX family)
MNKKYKIRCRGIIDEGKMLVVRHPHDTSFCALPGGHLEWGETPIDCIKREIIEELGIEPEIGRLLYVNTFFDGEEIQPIEFFFEIKNTKDYIDCEQNDRTHEHEVVEMVWADSEKCPRILPNRLCTDFKDGNILSDETRYISDF